MKGLIEIIKDMDSIIDEIRSADEILVCGHIMPDGDCISSVISLTLGLEQLGKKVTPAIDWKVPSNFYDFPGVGRIRRFDASMELPELMLVVDSSSPDRLGRFESLIKEGVRTAVVDHHITNTKYGNVSWVGPEYCSAAQMVYHLLKAMNIDYDEELALMNYLGIATDTGFFIYSNVSAEVFDDAAALTRAGADPAMVARNILDSRRIEEFYLQRDAVENMKIDCKGKFAYSFLEKSSYDRHKLTEDEFQGFVGELRSINTVEIAMFASEVNEGEAHVSLRSKTYFDVSEIAIAFGGGGHQKAAGFTLRYKGNIREALKDVVEFVKSKCDQ